MVLYTCKTMTTVNLINAEDLFFLNLDCKCPAEIQGEKSILILIFFISSYKSIVEW